MGYSAALLLALAACALATRFDDIAIYRDYYAASAKLRNRSMTDVELQKLVLVPPPALLSLPDAQSLEEADALSVKFRPSDLLAESLKTPLGNVDPVATLLARQAAGKRPVTIFVVCGMDGELYPGLPFEGTYNNESAFARMYASRLATTTITDTVYDMFSLQDIEMPLGQLVTAGSVDLANGTTLYQVVWMRQHEGSLESLTLPEHTVPRLISRMQKFLGLMATEIDEFALLGYSRGAIDVVDIMSQRDSLGWQDRLRTLIIFNGVVWGSHLGDCAKGAIVSNPRSLCDGLKEIADEVLVNMPPKLVPSLAAFGKNLKVLEHTLAVVANASLHMPLIPPQMRHTLPVFPDLARTYDKLIHNILFNVFDVMHLVSGYADNVRRLQKFIGAYADSMELLSTKNRVAWFAQHELPADAFYIVTESTQENADVTYASLHPDIYADREIFYLFTAVGAGELNDGQMSVPHALLLPRVHQSLNPRQKAYDVHWLAVQSTDHLGVAIDNVVPCPDNWTNPFPRLPVVDALASVIAART